VFNFDIENAFMGDNDPVMRQDEFEDEVNYLFNNQASTSTAVPGLSGLDSLNFDIKDLDNIFESDSTVFSSEVNSTTATHLKEFAEPEPAVSHAILTDNVEEKEDETPPVSPASPPVTTNEDSVTSDIHSYSVKPKSTSPSLRTHLRNTRGGRAKKSTGSRKRKLYELDSPLPTPELEKCRLNAINAKKNRDLKKQQLEMASAEIKRLRRENTELRDEVNSAREEMEELRAEMAAMKEQFKMAGMSVEDREE